MKFSYAIDPVRKIVFLRFEGMCNAGQVLVAISQLWADPGYDKTFDVYIDLTRMLNGAAFEDLNKLLDFLRDRDEVCTARIAAVTQSPVLTACGMLYQKAMSHRHAFAVFSSPEGARAHLNLHGPPPRLRELEIEPAATA